MATDPRRTLDERPMSFLQIAAVAVAVALNALDGFDVLAISFASPGIAKEWSIDQAALGVLLSLELIGMVAGSLFLGGLADQYGRRPMILFCLVLMTAGMALASTSATLVQLGLWRVLTGLGVGGMVATLNAVVSEFSNARRRSLCVALMVAGYPAGAVVGGSVAAMLLDGGDWRSVFQFGAIATFVMIPLVWFMVPESLSFLADRRPARALERINHILVRVGLAPVDELPAATAHSEKKRVPLLQILSGGRAATTLLVTAAYFGHIITFYFMLKWTAKLVADIGFASSAAATVLVWVNVGGIAGVLLFGLLSQKFPLKPLTIAILAGSFLSLWLFGNSPAELATLSLFAAIAGFFVNAGVAAIYAVFAQVFPSSLRATGTGFGVGIGRGGAILSPIIAGLFLDRGMSLATVAFIMGLGSVFGAIALFKIRIAPSPGSAASG